MQTMKHVVTTLVNFGWKILLLESVLLLVVVLIWRWTDWHITTGYGAALSIAGGIIIGLGLLALRNRGSSDDMILRKARMLNPDHKGQHQYTPHYAESTRVWLWLISLGIVTVGMGIVFNAFIPQRLGDKIPLAKSCLTQRAPDGWESPRFRAVFVASSWFRQNSVVCSRPPAGNASR